MSNASDPDSRPVPETSLATREFTDKQIQTRLRAAAEPGFGLDKATPQQLNIVYLLARHYDVDPVTDLTLFQGRPWFTIDGRVRIMKRHPEYRGFSCRPLSAEEKAAWDYPLEDLVVECTIRTRAWGDIVEYGRVTVAEMQRNTPSGSHPQEMARKRAIARASRLAFGQDVPDADAAVPVPEDAARTSALSARHTEIYGTEDDHDSLPQPAATTGNTTMLRRQHELRSLVERALKLGAIDRAPDAIAAGASPTQVEAAIQMVRGKLNQLTIAQAQRPTTAAQSEPGEVASPPAPRRAEMWATRRELEVKALELGIAVPTLNTRCADEELAEANDALRASIKAVEDDLAVESDVDPQEALV